MIHEGRRLRPIGKTKYNVKCQKFNISFELDHHQLWQVSAINENRYILKNSSFTMTIEIDEEELKRLFDTKEY